MALPVVKAVYNAPDYSQDEHLDVCVVLAIFAKKTAVFGCLTNALAPPSIALESCSMAQMDWPVF